MKLIFSHPTGNAFVRAAAEGLVRKNMLAEFYTSIALFPDSLSDRACSAGMLSEFRRRRFDSSLRPFTRTLPWRELGRMMASKAGWSRMIRHEDGIFSIDAVYRALDKYVAGRLAFTPEADGVYAYEDGALHSFRAAESLGISCLYDLPIGYWRTARNLMEEECSKWPGWKDTMPGFLDSEKSWRQRTRSFSVPIIFM
jgi:hypothetical protein